MKVYVVILLILLSVFFFEVQIFEGDLQNYHTSLINSSNYYIKNAPKFLFGSNDEISTENGVTSVDVVTLLNTNTSRTSKERIPTSLPDDASKYRGGNIQTIVNTTPKISLKKFINERSLCESEIKDIEIPSQWKNRCPDKPILAVHQGGRLGNQIYDYAALWAVAKLTNREPFAPSCLIYSLGRIFKNFTKIPPVKYIEKCPVNYVEMKRKPDETYENLIEKTNASIIMHGAVQFTKYVTRNIKEIIELFQFHDSFTKKSQDTLRRASKGRSDTVYVAVHVRRTDYDKYVKWKYSLDLVTEDFFIRQMDYFRHKYSNSLFVILSDDPDWCEKKLKSSDVVIIRGNSPEQDLSIMANCNHSIFDYGTYGTWGALLAGGETLAYNLTGKLVMPNLLPNWRLVT